MLELVFRKERMPAVRDVKRRPLANENVGKFSPEFIDRCELRESRRRSFSYAISSEAVASGGRVVSGRRQHAGGWVRQYVRGLRTIFHEEAFRTPQQLLVEAPANGIRKHISELGWPMTKS